MGKEHQTRREHLRPPAGLDDECHALLRRAGRQGGRDVIGDRRDTERGGRLTAPGQRIDGDHRGTGTLQHHGREQTHPTKAE